MRLQVLSAESNTEQTIYFKLIQVNDHTMELVATNENGGIVKGGIILELSNRGVRIVPNVSRLVGIATHLGKNGIEVDLID